MANVFILNGAGTYPFAKGELNAALAEKAAAFFQTRGDTVRITKIEDGYDVEAEIANHQWADIIIQQFPVNWMAMPWILKKYMDEVYSAGMDGRLCAGDGRVAEAPKANYGTGGTLSGKTYMLSVTLNAPSEAFDDPAEPLFAGLSLDQLLAPMHFNAKFFNMEPRETFAAYDVMKNPEIEADFNRFDAHLSAQFGQ